MTGFGHTVVVLGGLPERFGKRAGRRYVGAVCVSMDQADFSGTAVYAGRLHHPAHGLIHVLGYQNTAVNLVL